MATIFHVDFKNKVLIEKVCDEVEPPTTQTLPFTTMNKKEYFENLLSTGMVQVLINPRVRGVKLPPELKGDSLVALIWSNKFHIKDFVVDQKGVRGTLSFNSTNFFVDTPWKSIWAIFLSKSPKESMKIWESDVPKEISLSDIFQEEK